jgi:hypothetical protein
MTLPEVCPLDENQTCKGRECHLFCLEWRTREPTCLIGYNTTSKVRSGKDGRKKDTYAEDTFRKLEGQPVHRWKNVSEKGDWTPTRPVERPPERHLEKPPERHLERPPERYLENSPERHLERPSDRPVDRKEEKPSHAVERDPQKYFFGCRETAMDTKPERNPEEDFEKRPQGRQASSEAERASIRLEARLKKEPVEEDPIIYAKPQPKAQEKPKVQEKIISRDKHATIFASCDEEEKKNIYPSGREEKPRKTTENREKRKKLDEAMEIDLPDNYEEEFWS